MKPLKFNAASISEALIAYVLRPHLEFEGYVDVGVLPAGYVGEGEETNGGRSDWHVKLRTVDYEKYIEVLTTIDPLIRDQRIIYNHEYDPADHAPYIFKLKKVKKLGKKVLLGDGTIKAIYNKLLKDVAATFHPDVVVTKNLCDIAADAQKLIDAADAKIQERITELYPTAADLAHAIIDLAIAEANDDVDAIDEGDDDE